MQKNKLFNLIIYSYIALPFLIFAAGFLKWYFALLVSGGIIASVYLAAKDSKASVSLPFECFTFFRIAGGVALIVIMVLLSGIGNVMWQNNDHATRNTLFDVLVNYSWPPTYITDAGNEVGLVYYIGFWLPSALFGKLTTLGAGYIFQIIWAALGLLILWYLLCIIHKKIVIYPLVIFLFFSGMDLLGHSLITNLFDSLTKLQIGTWAFPQGSSLTTHIEWWSAYFQFSSHTTQLFWVFNQCIPVWIATVLMLIEKNNKNLVFIMGLTLISSTLPFIGLIPIFVWCAVCDYEGELLDRPFTKNIKASFFSLFTFQNVIGGGLSGIMTFIYLAGNVASTAASSTSTGSASTSAATFSLGIFILVVVFWLAAFLLTCTNKSFKLTKLLYLIPAVPLAYLMAKTPLLKLEFYLLFIIFEFIILTLLLLPAWGKSSLFFISVVSLLIIPFFKVGTSIDFCMRASIPLLVVLCIFSAKALDKYFSQDRQILATLLCIVLMLGAITPVKEIARVVEATAYEIQTKGSVVNDRITEHTVFAARNFTSRTENNIFYEIFSK
ncbi:MAG: hypothetical protein IJ435_04215 [Clostridia bacterium]|nr:hypothetical protein [Clostridia bacterium]